jgi:hypothetical protein
VPRAKPIQSQSVTGYSVLVRAKRTESIQRRRRSANGHAQSRPTSPVPQPNQQRVGRELRPAAERLTNDHAFYSCHCGYVFKAPVSTSVGCPHCGGTQAW